MVQDVAAATLAELPGVADDKGAVLVAMQS